jgi:hypothetical protein
MRAMSRVCAVGATRFARARRFAAAGARSRVFRDREPGEPVLSWISAVRPSRQPLRGFLRMTDFLNASITSLIPRNARRARLEGRTVPAADAVRVRALEAPRQTVIEPSHSLHRNNARLPGSAPTEEGVWFADAGDRGIIAAIRYQSSGRRRVALHRPRRFCRESSAGPGPGRPRCCG